MCVRVCVCVKKPPQSLLQRHLIAQGISKVTRCSNILLTVGFSCKPSSPPCLDGFQCRPKGLATGFPSPRVSSQALPTCPESVRIARHCVALRLRFFYLKQELPAGATCQTVTPVRFCVDREANVTSSRRVAETRKGHGVLMRARSRWESNQRRVCSE